MQSLSSDSYEMEEKESPEYVRLSLAAAMTLGFTKGWFYRNAKLRCINLLLTYESGCKANCAFCGLAGEKHKPLRDKKFIRVPWGAFPMSRILDSLENVPAHVGRVCISMITHPRSRRDVLSICESVVQRSGLGVSLLISPTVMKRDDLKSMKDAGADRIGVAIDAATPEIFDRFRGKPVGGPHRWDKYWRVYEQSLEVFGEGMSGVHLICGLGETEEEMTRAIQRARTMGGGTHLFSFFPEKGSLMEKLPAPPMGSYRRIQLARWLIDNDITNMDKMSFNSSGEIVGFGLTGEELDSAIDKGEAFETSGCPGPDGRVACNRPYGNEKPGQGIRNFPFEPDPDDLVQIRAQLLERSGACS